jgi:hypothetical protein
LRTAERIFTKFEIIFVSIKLVETPILKTEWVSPLDKFTAVLIPANESNGWHEPSGYIRAFLFKKTPDSDCVISPFPKQARTIIRGFILTACHFVIHFETADQ